MTRTVALGRATLQLLVLSAPILNASYTIINNDGTDAVNGTFSGLAQNATYTQGSYSFQINYAGGTGNDVVLTTTNVPEPATASLFGLAGLACRRRRRQIPSVHKGASLR